MSISSALAFLAIAIGLLILVYAIGALVVILFLRRVTRQDNVLGFTRRRVGPTSLSPDPRYNPKQYRTKR